MSVRIKRWSRRVRGVLKNLSWGIYAAAFFLVSSPALAGGGKPATKLFNVADTRDLTGLAKMFGDVYNENLWLYGLMTVVIMAGMGLVLGFGFDRLIGLVGIDLGKIDHHE